jgi:(p)ppGpp synthase/HD superfamily hydrolase
MSVMSVIKQAEAFAIVQHMGQVRKYTGEPYHLHVFMVGQYLKAAGESERVVVAGILHDILEDTDTTFAQLERGFGTKVAELVEAVTNVTKPGDGTRRERKQKELEHLMLAPPEAQSIKYADIIDNVLDVVKFDPDFAEVYLLEKMAIIRNLNKGNKLLREIARYFVCGAGLALLEKRT